MANQKLFPFAGHTEGKVGKLTIEWAVGATGTVGAITRGRGFGTPSRLGVGNFRVPLSEAWNALVDHNIKVIDVTPGVADGTHPIVSVRTITGSTPLIEFFTYRVDTGAAADPRNGAFISVTLELQNGQRV